MNIDLITKTEYEELKNLLIQIDAKLEHHVTQTPQIVKGKQLQKILGNISSSSLNNLKQKEIIPYMLIEKTYYYDVNDVLQALKVHQTTTTLKIANTALKSALKNPKPPSPLDFNYSYKTPSSK